LLNQPIKLKCNFSQLADLIIKLFQKESDYSNKKLCYNNFEMKATMLKSAMHRSHSKCDVRSCDVGNQVVGMQSF